MKQAILLFSILISTYCNAQNKRSYFDEYHQLVDSSSYHTYSNSHGDENVTIEEFYSLTDSLIKTKLFERKNDSNHLRLISYYYNGIDKSFQDYYSDNIIKPDSSHTYYPDGKIYRREFYDSVLAVNNTCYDTAGFALAYKKLRPTDFFDCKYTQQDFFLWIARNTEYPREARETGITGKVWVSFIIEAGGKITNFKVTKGTETVLDKAALDVLKKANIYPCPVIIDGLYHRTIHTMPISFETSE